MRSRFRRVLLLLAVLLLTTPLIADTFSFGGPRSTDNDDSCDVAALPAATLLLPYFEVDISNASGETTLFTVTNTGDRAQIVRVTLWTDYAYPVVSFNIYLTGYDMHIVNANILPQVYAVCRASGFEPPFICTPSELMEPDDD